MSTVKADTVQPKDFATDLTLGASGDTVTVAGDSILTDKVQDKGGNTLWDYSTGVFVSTKKEFASQNLKLLSTQTASSSASVSFRTGIDSTYDVYIFTVNIHGTLAGGNFNFQCSTDGGSNYNTTITSSAFRTKHLYSGSTALNLESGYSQAQGTSYQTIAGYARSIGDFSGTSVSGEVWLFNPASTNFVKQFHTNLTLFSHDEATVNYFMAGYYNTTSAINAISFKPSNGQFYGNIKMYGIS